MIFSIKLRNGQDLEIGNEVKSPSVTKSTVNATRVRVLKTAKRQLHKRLKYQVFPTRLLLLVFCTWYVTVNFLME